MNSCDLFSLCWIIWTTLWRHLVICLAATLMFMISIGHLIRANRKKSLQDAGYFLLGTLLPFLIAVFYIGVYFDWQREPETGAVLRFASEAQSLFWIYILFHASFLTGLAFLTARWRHGIWLLFWNSEARTRRIVLCAVIAYASIVAINILSSWYGYSSGDSSRHLVTQVTAGGGLAVLFVGILAMPAAEELFFRGFLQTRLKAQYGIRVGISIQALCFAILHLTYDGSFFTYWAFGMVFGLSFYYSKSLLAPLAAHMLNNGLVMLLPPA